MNDGQTCWMTDLRCPECGSALNTNGRLVWCSFIGSQRPGGEPACRYGLDADVTRDEYDASLLPPPEAAQTAAEPEAAR